ncbi:craniofacial development protein 2-like [Aplysia californica]|uniref:Craniofacial development protein 2-like n=1 Tax=Aplysia californica TaxID=6500 RepID=A0ABM1A391_APLCA|nr:craniofacial development protein 2-like [Aplysia californica]
MASFTTRSKSINMIIVQIYAPTNDASDNDKDAFYSRLQGVIDKLPRKDVNIIMGDANAKIGQYNVDYEGIMGQHGLGQMNENGERFANLCAFNSLVIGGSVFPHKRIHKATWVSQDGRTENQIDHFCISRRFRRSQEDVQRVTSFYRHPLV